MTNAGSSPYTREITLTVPEITTAAKFAVGLAQLAPDGAIDVLARWSGEMLEALIAAGGAFDADVSDFSIAVKYTDTENAALVALFMIPIELGFGNLMLRIPQLRSLVEKFAGQEIALFAEEIANAD